MRLLHLSWPHLALRLARQRPPGNLPGGPLILGGQPWDDGVVLDANQAARDLGVRRGIPLGQAHRLAPEATFVPTDPGADATAVEAALDVLAAFSPGIAGTIDAADPAFGTLEVQLDGLEPLWGPEPIIVAKVRAALAPLLPGVPWAGIAGTRFAAALAAAAPGAATGPRTAAAPGAATRPRTAAASGAATGPDQATGPAAVIGLNPAVVPCVRVPPGGDAAFLAPFPAAALSRDPDVRARLARFGLTTIGEVGALPRSALVARFGADVGARLHDRANGRETDPFRPRRSPERLALGLSTDEPIVGLEAVRFILRRLAGALAAQLDARGSAAGRARLALTLDPTFRPDRLPLPGEALPRRIVEQRFPEPSADPEALERLLLARLEKDPPAAPIVRLDLELLDVTPAAGHQLALFVPQANAAARLGWQLARLAVRYGEGRVGRLALADPEAPLPESRWTWRPMAADGAEPVR